MPPAREAPQPTASQSRLSLWLSRSRLVLIVASLLAVVAGGRTVLTYMHLKSDLEELLPSTAPSVLALEHAKKRLLGLHHLGIVVDIPDPERAPDALRFVADLRARVEAYPKSVVALVRSDVRAEREFFETFGLQLADPADLRALREAAEARRRWEISRAMSVQLLDETEAPPPEVPVRQFIEKYSARQSGLAHFPNDQFLSEDRRTAVLVLQTGPEVSGFTAETALLERIEKDAAELGFPGAYAPGLRMGFAGDVASRVEETRGLAADLGISSLVVLVLVLGSIYWFCRTWAAWPVLVVPVLFGTLYTFGLVALPPLEIRSLNSNTAFLASIIIGNGINSGIILLARVQEQLRSGERLLTAIENGVRETWRPTLAAALAAAAAYGSLTFTGFRGFKQFGWIGGLGMPVCWLTTYLLAPPLMMAFGPALRGRAVERGRLAPHVASLVLTRPRVVLGVFGVLLFASLIGLAQRRSDWLETDFSRLRRADSFVNGERYWGKRMDETLRRYLTPAVVMTGSADEAEAVARAVRDVAASGKAGGLIASARSFRDVVPATRDEAVAEARKLAALFNGRLREAVPEAQRPMVEKLLSERALRPVTPEDIPATLMAGLRDRDGHHDRNVLVFPILSSGTWNAERLSAFAQDLREAVQGASPTAIVTGPLLLSSDIIGSMRSDGARATAIAFGFTLLVAFFAFRGFELSALAMTSLFLGIALMLGIAAWLGQRLNFCNFVALPITFGVAADYSINVLQRCQSSRSLRDAVINTGGAVALCSITTIIGFGSLLVAQNGALFSFGALAVTGEITCLATAVLVIAAYLALNPKVLLPRPPPESPAPAAAPGGSAPRFES